LTTEHVELALLKLVKASTIVVGSLEVPLPSIVHAALITAMRGATFVLNPSPGRHLPPDLVRQCASSSPNEIELLQLGFDSPADLIADGAGAVVVTRGDRGASVRTSSASWEQPAFPLTPSTRREQETPSRRAWPSGWPAASASKALFGSVRRRRPGNDGCRSPYVVPGPA